MAIDVKLYQKTLSDTEEWLNTRLASGKADAKELATIRRQIEMMTKDLESPGSLDIYESAFKGGKGAEKWQTDAASRADKELFPETATQAGADAYHKKRVEYLDFAQEIATTRAKRKESFDRGAGKSYLTDENPTVIGTMQTIGTEFRLWFDRHSMSHGFMAKSALDGFKEFMAERTDIAIMLRLAQEMPLDKGVADIGISRPLSVHAVELAIGLIPVVGSAVAAYEAYAGEDLFGYKLTAFERAVLAATVLLPIAGKFVKGGRALYSESRLVSLYGRDVKIWSHVVESSERAASHGPSVKAVASAEVALRTTKSVPKIIAQEAAAALPKLVDVAPVVSKVVDKAIVDAFEALAKQHKILAGLDAQALERVIGKGTNADHVRGQLLEELLETEIVPWLRDSGGALALGVKTGGKPLEFIPGHLIRGLDGRQLSDGLLVIRNGGALEIVAVFEAKAGNRAARELSLSSGSFSKLTGSEQDELRHIVLDQMKDELAAARIKGLPYTRTFDEVLGEYKLAELGGQVGRDIERFSKDKLIRVGGFEETIKFTPSNVKFFGVLPSDVKRSTVANIEKALASGKYEFEILGIDIKQADLTSIADQLKALCTKAVMTPPRP